MAANLNASGPNEPTVSWTFFLGANLRYAPEDVLVVTQDNVWFYVHAIQLLNVSRNNFAGLVAIPQLLLPTQQFWPPQEIEPAQQVAVAERSNVFNILLHSIYELDVAPFNPTTDDIVSAIDAMPRYGIEPKHYIIPGKSLFEVLIKHLPDLYPANSKILPLYALAGHYDLYHLAVHCSQFLIPLRAQEIPDRLAVHMGVRYLKQLVFLRLERVQALREILREFPQEHLAIPQCPPGRQDALRRAWRLTGAYYLWNAQADLSAVGLQLAYMKLNDNLTCEMCKAALRNRVDVVVAAWSNVKRTIV